MKGIYLSIGRAHRNVLPATVLLVTLGYVDMIYTLIAVRLGWAHEANPIMAAMLNRSDGAFIAYKLALLVVPITILELMRPKDPNLSEAALKFGSYAYLGLYGVGSIAARILGI